MYEQIDNLDIEQSVSKAENQCECVKTDVNTDDMILMYFLC